MWTTIMGGGLGRFLRRTITHGVWVLCFHGLVESIADPRLERNLTLLADFRSQTDSLRQLEVVRLEELLHELPVSSKRRKPMCAITFDDGYANNLLAGELLAAARLPWTLFVSTSAIGRYNAIWTVELSLLLLHGRATKVEALGKVWPLTSRLDRETSFQGIRLPLKELPGNLRQEAMAFIRGQFPQGETQRLLHEFPSLQMLTWEEVGQLAQDGVEIGSHGVNHEIHHEYQLENIRRLELTESKTELEQRLGRPCRFFAFPNGDYNSASAAEVRDAGYEMGFTLERRANLPGDNPYLLPRLNRLEESVSLPKFVRNFFRT